MKKIKKIVAASLSLLIVVAFVTSCDKMNDIQSKFTDTEEQVYLGKVDSLRVIPGFGRAKITWYISADPKVEQTVIYWNMRNDSIVKDFHRIGSGLQQDSIIIENLPEGSTLFEFRNKNKKGESSLYSSITVTSLGSNYADGLAGKRIGSTKFDFDKSSYTLEFSGAFSANLIYSQVSYRDKGGTERIINVDSEENSVTLPNFADGTEYRLRNIFFIPGGMDTIYSGYKSYQTPTVIYDNGTKIALTGNTETPSRYSERPGVGMYEWNDEGDLILYSQGSNGEFTQAEKYAALVSRETYRDFFFYDFDRFIAIGENNAVTMHVINENGSLGLLGAAAGFGTGFGMQIFLPTTKGYFFSIDNGAIRTWLAKNDATWGAPNGSTVGTGFTYNPVIVFDQRTLVGIDEDGYLWNITFTNSGGLGVKNCIGSGWEKFKQLASYGSTLLGIDENGDIYRFDFNPDDKYYILK